MKMTRKIMVGGVAIGGGADVSVQSMANTDTRDVQATLRLMERLREAGCDIVRLAVPDMEAAEALRKIVSASPIPVVADIHFDWRLALASAEAGVHKIRINPGNIGGRDRVERVARACMERGIPIRVGVNGGSVPRELLEKHRGVTAEALCESAEREIDALASAGFVDICVSIKSSSVPMTVKANIMFSEKHDFPIHIGVTEAGTERMGVIKSAAGIGGLLSLGVGDTVRVSLTADPVREVYAAKAILKAVGLSRSGVEIISCPSCGRCGIDLISIANEVEERLSGVHEKLVVAVMGCAVNGPGEARHADAGVAGGNGEGVLFMRGEIVGKVPEDRIADGLIDLVSKLIGGEAAL